MQTFYWVYLHGGVEKPFERLVLTDSDFGRAYLTEGWARVFLQKLFEKHTVLFVGYSHDDPVMNYLARGLPPAGTRKRFALTSPGQEENWRYRGIVPITYQLAHGDNPHSVLPLAIASWSKQMRLGALEQEQRIKAIVELPPPIDPQDSDYIESALSDPATTRFFRRHANTVAWLKWVEDRKLLRQLFDPNAALTEVDGELGLWFVERFQCEYVGESLSVLRRQGQRFSAYLWSAAAQRLLRHPPNRPSSEALHRWLPVLINNRPPGTRLDMLEYVSPHLVFPEDAISALLLFEYLSRPIFRLKDDFWSKAQEGTSREDVNFELETHGGGFWLNELWVRFFSPNLDALIDRLEPIVTSHLQQAYLLSHSDGKSDNSRDALSLSRDAVEHPDQGQRHEGFGVLVDVGYAAMHWNVQHRPQRADSLIELWLTADSFLLKRLAIIGVSLSTHWTGDRKLAWLLSNDLLYKPGISREVFEVLKGAFPLASDGPRKDLIARANEGPKPVPVDRETAAVYETYCMLYWLQQSDPECPLANGAFSMLQAAHPEFVKPEHLDPDVVSGGGRGSDTKVQMT